VLFDGSNMEECGFNVVQAYHTCGVLASVSGLWVSHNLTQPTNPYQAPP
jgi:hypothetical protein